jgi:hypothetical protein
MVDRAGAGGGLLAGGVALVLTTSQELRALFPSAHGHDALEQKERSGRLDRRNSNAF